MAARTCVRCEHVQCPVERRYSSGSTSRSSREARVCGRAVVALEVVLDPDLPVGVEDPLRAPFELERVEVEPRLGDGRRNVAERVCERSRLQVGVHEHEGAPGVDLDPVERQLLDRQVGLTLPAGHGSQAAVEAVRPGVVGALERPPVALAGHDLVAAVAADVHEAAQLTLLVPDDRHRVCVPRARRRSRRVSPPGRPVPRTATSARRCALARAPRMASSVYHEAGSVQPSARPSATRADSSAERGRTLTGVF